MAPKAVKENTLGIFFNGLVSLSALLFEHFPQLISLFADDFGDGVLLFTSFE